MAKLNQINALVTGRKGEAEKAVGDIYKVAQKPELFYGISRVYRPYDEEHGEKLPPERKTVQFTVGQLTAKAREKWSELWDLTFTQDAANQYARADIVVDGKVILKDVAVTSLLFLEKQVNDVETFVSKLPTPDTSEKWTWDGNVGLLRCESRDTVRTKKEPSHYEKAPATKEHAAQVEFFYKDVGVGVWTQTLFSGGIPVDKRDAILSRLRKLKDAIKLAREQANSIEAKDVSAAKPLFEFILGDSVQA